MKVNSEPLPAGATLLRIFDDDQEWGDSYGWSAVCVPRGTNAVEIKGAMQAPTLSQWRALYQYFQQLGVKVVQYRRGDSRLRRIKITGASLPDR